MVQSQASRPARGGGQANSESTQSAIRAPRRAAVSEATSAARSSSHVKAPSSRGLYTTNTTGIFKSAKVDTNIKSYDRRDPFTAFNALVKLLASLPSRVIAGGGRGSSGGGCQFKFLSIDEHKLCMHLCNIVEPFLLSSPLVLDTNNNFLNSNASGTLLFKPRTLLIHQPTEILDRITSSIESRSDLMSFGTTCKRLGEIVFPRHWEYRLIRAKVSMTGVWKHLCERADLAANVRCVEVLDERLPSESSKKGISVVVPGACRKAMIVGGGAAGAKREEMVVLSATSTEEDGSSISTNEDGAIGMLGTTKLHRRQEKYFVAALAKMTGLAMLKWESNHSPISVVDSEHGTIWRTVVDKCGGSLRSLEVADNMVFSRLTVTHAPSDEEGKCSKDKERRDEHTKVVLANLRSASLRSTHFNYGATRDPEMNRIVSILHQCPNLETLEIIYKAPKSGGFFSLPVANDFLNFGRWSHLTSLTLVNLSCLNAMTTVTIPYTAQSSGAEAIANTIQRNPLQTFLSAHPNLEILKLLNLGPVSQFRRLNRTPLERNTLPKLRELHAGKEVVNMILKAECDEPRPLETIKGFKLVGAAGVNVKHVTELGDNLGTGLGSNAPNLEFYKNLKNAGGTVKRIEVEAWGDLDDVRMLAWCVPKLTWLDVGRRLRLGSGSTAGSGPSQAGGTRGSGLGQAQAQGPVTNMIEWTETLSCFEELTTFHGVKFFYEISPNAVPQNVHGATIPNSNDTSTGSLGGPGCTTMVLMGSGNVNMSMTDRSRIKKNDEIAGVLAWKCPKLRWVDHWEGAASGRVIVLLRESDFGPGFTDGKVRWDVRRVKQ